MDTGFPHRVLYNPLHVPLSILGLVCPQCVCVAFPVTSTYLQSGPLPRYFVHHYGFLNCSRALIHILGARLFHSAPESAVSGCSTLPLCFLVVLLFFYLFQFVKLFTPDSYGVFGCPSLCIYIEIFLLQSGQYDFLLCYLVLLFLLLMCSWLFLLLLTPVGRKVYGW